MLVIFPIPQIFFRGNTRLFVKYHSIVHSFFQYFFFDLACFFILPQLLKTNLFLLRFVQRQSPTHELILQPPDLVQYLINLEINVNIVLVHLVFIADVTLIAHLLRDGLSQL